VSFAVITLCVASQRVFVVVVFVVVYFVIDSLRKILGFRNRFFLIFPISLSIILEPATECKLCGVIHLVYPPTQCSAASCALSFM
jgi:hypothetical protein